MPDHAVSIISKKKKVWFFKEGVRSGGVGQALALRLIESDFKGVYKLTAIGDEFVHQASVSQLLNEYKLDTDGMFDVISEDI